MDIDALNAKINAVKTLIKAIPPNMLGENREKIQDFMTTVDGLQNSVETSLKQIKTIKDALSQNVKNTSTKVDDMINLLSK